MSNSNSCLTTLFSGGGGGGGGEFFSKKTTKRNTSSRLNARRGSSSSSEPPSQHSSTDLTMGKRIALFAAIVPTSCSVLFLASWGGTFGTPPAAKAREEESFGGSKSSKRSSAKGGSSTNVENGGEILSGKINLNGRRLVAIGDVHGDFPAAMKALEIAGVMDNKGEWIGKNTVVVQVGDVMDRGDAELAIFTKFLRLKKKAMKEGGDVIVMNGNHEIMNVMGDFRYATNGAYLECGTYLKKMKEKEESSGSGGGGSSSSANSNKENASPDSNNSTNESSNESEKSPLKKASEQFQNEDPVIQGVRARRELFQPGGAFAMKLSKHPTVLQVGDTIFAHAGVNQSHVKYGFDRINREVSLWMQGKIKNPPDYIVESEGVVWTREYGGKDAGVKYEAEACRRLKSALALTSDPEAKRLVIGHTPQTTGVNSGCKGAVWRVDVGASRGIYGGTVEVLEIKGSRVRVLS